MQRLICNLFSSAALCFLLSTTACSRDASRPSDLDRTQLRAELHELLVGNTTINNRDTWQVIAAGSASAHGTIRLFYKRILLDSSHRASGPKQNQPDYWNREHVWPQSYGLRGTIAARDLHNIVPVDRTVNTSRSNKLFDVASQSHYECSDCRTNATVWEPPDAVKGDVARILFYMDARYNGGEGEPELILSDTPDKHQATFGRLSALGQWHCRDHVSPEEMHRNEVIADAQGNRNLFIDHPELAERLYGFDCRR